MVIGFHKWIEGFGMIELNILHPCYEQALMFIKKTPVLFKERGFFAEDIRDFICCSGGEYFLTLNDLLILLENVSGGYGDG